MQTLYTAITTPFNEDNMINTTELLNHIRFLINANSGIVLFGTTGECPTVSLQEKIDVMQILTEFDKNKFIIGVGGNNTNECIELARLSILQGFTNIMITTPYYNKPSQEGLYMHFKTIADYHLTQCSRLSLTSNIVLYNVPGRSIVNITPETVKRICNNCSNVTAIKEASGNLNQVISIRTMCPNIKVFSGDDALMMPMMSVGACGLISVVSNIIPKKVYDILNLCKNNHYDEAFTEYSKIHKFTELMFCESNPVPIKYALQYAKIYNSSDVRLPLARLSNINCNNIELETEIILKL